MNGPAYRISTMHSTYTNTLPDIPQRRLSLDKILTEGRAGRRDAYIEFLKTGESDYPIELLKIAGVDMSTS